jgi:hypothetical protein
LRSDAEQRVLRNGLYRCGPGSGASRKEGSESGSRPAHLQVPNLIDVGMKFFDILGKVVKPSNFYLIFLDHKQW